MASNTLKETYANLLITVLMFTESQLLTPEVLESPELNLVLLTTIDVIPSVVFDSESDRKCFAPLFWCIWDGKVPTGSVLERCVDVDIFKKSSGTFKYRKVVY